MIETHTIRLRGPWKCDIGERLTRVHMPAQRQAVVGDEYRGPLICHRKFGCPTCLDPHERVWLVIELPAQSGEAMLNGERLGPFQRKPEPIQFDITQRLKERNELILAFDFARSHSDAVSAHTAPDALLFKEVRLEIRG
jgi:hypothetical protein